MRPLFHRFPTVSRGGSGDPPLKAVQVALVGEDCNHQKLPCLPKLLPPPLSQKTAIRLLHFCIAVHQLQSLVVAVAVAEQLDFAHFEIVGENQLPGESGFDRRGSLGHPKPASCVVN